MKNMVYNMYKCSQEHKFYIFILEVNSMEMQIIFGLVGMAIGIVVMGIIMSVKNHRLNSLLEEAYKKLTVSEAENERNDEINRLELTKLRKENQELKEEFDSHFKIFKAPIQLPSNISEKDLQILSGTVDANGTKVPNAFVKDSILYVSKNIVQEPYVLIKALVGSGTEATWTTLLYHYEGEFLLNSSQSGTQVNS